METTAVESAAVRGDARLPVRAGGGGGGGCFRRFSGRRRLPPWDWVLDSDGRLTISPNPGFTNPQQMPDFAPGDSPWYRYADQIKSVAFAYADSGFVLSIGRNAFMDCTGHTEINLPDSVTAIGDSVFSGCTGLTEITLPDSIITIGDRAFSGCTDLTSITFTSDTSPTIDGGAFANCDKLTEIRVPAGAEGAYRKKLSDAGLDLDGGGIEVKVEYSITVTATEGGAASASPDFAAEGEEITLTAVPDSDYRFKEWQVVSGGVTADSGRFEMPAGAVTVKAVFEKEDAPQPSHTHAWAGAWSRNSSHHWHECLAEGCTILSDSGKDGYAAHSFGEWIVDQAATSTTSGSKHRVCGACQYQETQTIPPEHSHSYGQGWESDADGHWHECSCGDQSGYAAHTPGDWIVEQAATSSTAGSRHKEYGTMRPVSQDKKESARGYPFAGIGGTMNKQELIERMADKTGLTRKDCGTALDGFLSTVTEALQVGDAVKLVGFGSFEVKHRVARTGHNPQTKAPVEIPAQTIPMFKAGKGLKDSIAG